MPRAIVCVTNDLATDNRVHRSCMVLREMGWDVLLVGRRLPHSPLMERPYTTRRMRLLFNKGPLFYAELSLRLCILLLFSKQGPGKGLLLSNDLDTLLPCFLAARLRRWNLVYDSHEFFTEVPELFKPDGNSRFARRVWLAIERWIFPKLEHIITVNDSIANACHERYGKRPRVVRNIPMPRDLGPLPSRAELGLLRLREAFGEARPEDRFILVMQGSGINVERGAEEAVLAMRELPGCLLLLIGGGDAWPVLERMVEEHGLHDRVRMLPRMPYEEMMRYTRNADLGLSLDKGTSLNYRFSLPNKLFDYFRAGIPVLATDLPEVAGIVRQYGAGIIIPGPDPGAIAAEVLALMADPARREALREKAIFAAASLDGTRETEALRALFEGIG